MGVSIEPDKFLGKKNLIFGKGERTMIAMTNVEMRDGLPIVPPNSLVRNEVRNQGIKSPTDAKFPPAITISPRATIEDRPYRAVYPGMPVSITLSPPARIGSPPVRKEEYK